MPEFWLDANCLIEPKQHYYPFDVWPVFWAFLEQKGKDGVIASCARVYTELQGIQDELAEWAEKQRAEGFFIEPDLAVSSFLSDIRTYLTTCHKEHRIVRFMDGADPWLIAHAKIQGGRIVTHETEKRHKHEIKIPDVANHFGVDTLGIVALLRELGAKFN